MSIALKELLRQPRRFFPVGFALTLLVVLLVVLGGFLDGLELGQTGPYRAQGDAVFVFDDDANLQLGRSRVSADAVTTDTDGVGDVGTIDVTFSVAATDGGGDITTDDDDLYDIALYGYSLATDTLPEPPESGKAIVDYQLQRLADVEVGDTLAIGPTGEEITIDAIVKDLTAGAPTVWVNPDDWRSIVTAGNPAAVPPDGIHNALVVQPSDGTDPATLVSTIDNLDGVEAATVDDVIGALSVVQQQSSTFEAIIIVTFVVSLLVVALFFALLTLERSRMYAVFKALGARTGELLVGLSTQAVVITVVALVIGMTLSYVFVYVLPPNLPVRVLPIRLVQIAIGLLVTALIGSLLTARRILRIDPATAIG